MSAEAVQPVVLIREETVAFDPDDFYAALDILVNHANPRSTMSCDFIGVMERPRMYPPAVYEKIRELKSQEVKL